MIKTTISDATIVAWRHQLHSEERSPGTIENYLRHVRAFAAWLGDRPLSRDAVQAWKQQLIASRYEPATVNNKLVALNRFLSFLHQDSLRVKLLRVQYQLFRDDSRELSRAEYERLLNAARTTGKERLALVMETLCASGIRVSELRYVTIEAARRGRAEISLKGKICVILLPRPLCKKLTHFAAKNKAVSGEIFLTRNGRSLSRKQIWAEMKSLARLAHVAASKVFPHNLRHRFARVYYKATRDVAQLADVLGHSSIETTRIYLIATGAEHMRNLENLQLVQRE